MPATRDVLTILFRADCYSAPSGGLVYLISCASILEIGIIDMVWALDSLARVWTNFCSVTGHAAYEVF
ncbi:hypothetical protein NEOLEDRAFT_1130941 [Neolentinus lepideus HHB14362 ss-1]|uniref:Uncharacterized protein n=1 Tax=Neolentinus lepideus HHB14362 ss-1 TaxID=1314782 RepID=A0A165TZ92_9AGAM|nr:hypothetical protein NEOLEDRAFT_1130941 [Neolentinus lepideus HHB14362 ss-1]